MPTGTVTLTNKSAVISGAGTTFTTELAAGDFLIAVVGGIPYNLPIKTVDSNTKLTAISNYLGPTTSGLAWMIAPRSTQNLITAAIVVQNTEALRGFNYDKQNWQQLLTVDGDVTVTLPDNTQFSGPSWIKIARLATDSDLSEIKPLADQVRADAQQVTSDKNEAKVSAAAAKVSETNAATSETNAGDSDTAAAQSASESAASAVSASGMATAATAQADRAKNEADRAAASNPANALLKASNLSDVESKAASLANLIDSKPVPTGGDPVNPLDASNKQWSEKLAGGVDSIGPIALRGFIRGLDITVSTTSLTVSPGAASTPGTGEIINVAAQIMQPFPALTASTWYHIYLYSNAGAAEVEIVTVDPVAYAYPAHQKTGDASRRYIGSLRTTSGNVVLASYASSGKATYLINWYGGSNRVLSAGTATTPTAVAVASLCPPVVSTYVDVAPTNGATGGAVSISALPTAASVMTSFAPNGKYYLMVPLLSYPNIYYMYISAVSGGGFFIDVGGYEYAR